MNFKIQQERFEGRCSQNLDTWSHKPWDGLRFTWMSACGSDPTQVFQEPGPDHGHQGPLHPQALGWKGVVAVAHPQLRVTSLTPGPLNNPPHLLNSRVDACPTQAPFPKAMSRPCLPQGRVTAPSRGGRSAPPTQTGRE